MTANDLIMMYRDAVTERDALNAGTLTAEETAGYWLDEASHAPRREFSRMLKERDILLSRDPFYAKVNSLLLEVCG